jgi:hypothetical protein
LQQTHAIRVVLVHIGDDASLDVRSVHTARLLRATSGFFAGRRLTIAATAWLGC